MAFKIGQQATYFSAKGDQKLALITGTPETVSEGTDLPTLNPDHYAITVFSPTGAVYGKYAIPALDGDSINKDEYVIDGTPRGVLVPLA